jgi:endonuclease YncB( thermonuclease family)
MGRWKRRRVQLAGLAIAVLAAVVLTFGPSAIAAPATAADLDCSDFDNQREAQQYFESIGGPESDPDRLDSAFGEGDGIACESLPCPCGSGASPRPAPRPQPRTEPRQAQTIKARVTDVIDGDTIRVRPLEATRRNSYTVRLIGIDTPETRKPGTPVECGGLNATASLKRLAEGRRMLLRTDPTQDTFDRYDRLLAYAKLRSGLDAATAQLRRGWAKVYVFGRPFQHVTGFRRAAKAAQRADRGVWGRCFGQFHTPER